MTAAARAEVRPWPELMRAETAAAYVDEVNAAAFLRRAGTVYPAGRKVDGRGKVWAKTDLDQAIAELRGVARGSRESGARDL